MRTTKNLFQLLVLVALGHATDASAFTITITSNGYRGNYKVDAGDLVYDSTEVLKLELAAGQHSLEFGAAVGNSNILFTVGADGSVSQFAPKQSVTPGTVLGTFAFRTVKLTVIPGKYKGDYLLSAYHKGPKLFRGDQSVVLIAGLVYHIDTPGSSVMYWCSNSKCDPDAAFPSYCYFTVSPNGTVKVMNTVATADGTKGRLRLNSTKVRITQDMIPKNGFVYWSGDKNTHITLPTTIRVIPGLSAWIWRSDKPAPAYFVERMFSELKPLVPLP